jgi:shikimate 5-dehydrogenase
MTGLSATATSAQRQQWRLSGFGVGIPTAELRRALSSLSRGLPEKLAGHPGTAIPEPLMNGASRAFDAVYTPVDTEFLGDASSAGLEVMSGYELFFHQALTPSVSSPDSMWMPPR